MIGQPPKLKQTIIYLFYKQTITVINNPCLPKKNGTFWQPSEQTAKLRSRQSLTCHQQKLVVAGSLKLHIFPGQMGETQVYYMMVLRCIIWGFLNFWYPTTMGFSYKNHHFGLFLEVPPFKETPIYEIGIHKIHTVNFHMFQYQAFWSKRNTQQWCFSKYRGPLEWIRLY